MTRTVFTQSIREQRRSLIIWAISLAAVVFFYVPSYQTYADQGLLDMKSNGMLEAMGMQDMASPVGYLNSTMFALMGPLLLVIFASIAGSRTAAQEESGTLDLLLAQPIGRVKLLVHRFLALLAGTAFLTGAFLGALIAAASAGKMEIGVGNIVATTVGLGLLTLTFGAIAQMVGALTGRRVLALGAAAGLAVVTYFANTLGGQSESAEWLKYLSPFFWFNGANPLANGWNFGHLAVLAALPLLALAVSVWRFTRRDLAV